MTSDQTTSSGPVPHQSPPPRVGDPTRSGLRLLVVALCCAALAGLVLAQPAAPGTPAGAGQLVRISHAVLGCDAALTGTRQVSVASGLVADGVAGPDGTAALRTLGAGRAKAQITAVGLPASLTAVGGPQTPVVAAAQGSWAAGLVTGIAGRVTTGSGAGLYSAQCLPVRSNWWFVGAGSTLGRRDVLSVSNPSTEPARFDVELLGRDGPVDAVAGRGLEVAGKSQVELRLDALAPGEDILAVQVSATAGQVIASVTTVAAPVADQPRGADVLAPATDPANDLVIAGIPAGSGKRTLVLANPGSEFATAGVASLTSAGSSELPELSSVAVPANSVVSIDLSRALKGRSATLHLTSDQPITGALRAVWGAKARELLWLTATPLVGGSAPLAGAGAVPAGAGLAATVTVAAPGQAAFGTLTIVARGTGDKSQFSPDSAVPGRASAWAPLAYPGDDPQVTTLRINVPAGTQRQLTLAATAGSDVMDLYWVADPGSALAAISHTVATVGLTGPSQDGVTDAGAGGDSQPLATGMQWWPTVGAVPAVSVSAQVGVLVPQGS